MDARLTAQKSRMDGIVQLSVTRVYVRLSVEMASSSATTKPVTMETLMMAMGVLETAKLKRQVGHVQ